MEEKIKKDHSRVGLPAGYIRTTIIIKEEFLEMVRAYTYWKREKLVDVHNQIFSEFMKKQDFIDTINEFLSHTKDERGK